MSPHSPRVPGQGCRNPRGQGLQQQFVKAGGFKEGSRGGRGPSGCWGLRLVWSLLGIPSPGHGAAVGAAAKWISAAPMHGVGSQRQQPVQEEFMLSHCRKMRNTLQDFTERLCERGEQSGNQRLRHLNSTCNCHQPAYKAHRERNCSKKTHLISGY